MNKKNETLSPLIIVALFLLLALIWGSSFILMKKGLQAFSPYQIGAIRMVMTATCLLPFGLRYLKQIPADKWKYFLMLGILGNGIPAVLFPLAETKINSATAGMLNALTPVFTLVLGVILFDVAFSLRKTMGILLGFGGAILLMLTGYSEVAGTEISWQENILYSGMVVLSTAFYGANVNMMKRHLNDVPSIATASFSFGMVSIPFLLYLLYAGEIDNILLEHPKGWESLGYLSILSILGSAFSTIVFYWVVQKTDALVASSVTYLMPIVACGWGIYQGEKIAGWQYLGLGVILVGVYLVNRKEKELK